MTALDFSIPFGLGLVSSLHCTQMCGPIVLAYSMPLQSNGRRAVSAHLSYNAGRLLTYSLLGAVAGAVGQGFTSLGRLAGIESTAAIVAGAAMILAGVLMIGLVPKVALVRIGAGIPTVFSRSAGRLLRSDSPASKLTLGFLLGFLPCGLIYAALLKALDAGSAPAGALTMLGFGLGTTAALLAIGLFSSAITSRFGRYANRLAAAGVILLGAFLLWRGLTPVMAGTECHPWARPLRQPRSANQGSSDCRRFRPRRPTTIAFGSGFTSCAS